jgi:anti-anti-sigma factor
MQTYKIKQTVIGHISILEIEGDLNIANTKKLIEVIRNAISESSFVIIDLSNISYINSTAIGALIGFRQHKNNEIKIVISYSNPVYSIMKTLELHKFFNIYNSIDEAL